MAPCKRAVCYFDILWLLAWGMAASAWCLAAGRQLGGTYDEPIYLRCGLDHWHTGSPAPLMKLGTMPLPVDVVTLPLYLQERWSGAIIDPVRDWERVLPWARAATLVFWWVLLLYAWKSARLLAGPWAGRLVVPLLACEPNLLAHSALATTDLAISACLLALVYSFRAARDASWPRRVVWPALWFGLALLAKASALVFGPLCLVVVGVEHLIRTRVLPALALPSWRLVIKETWRQFRPLRLDLSWVLLGGLVLSFVYVGCDWKAEKSFVAWAKGVPDGSARTCLVWLAENLRVFSNAGEGLIHQVTHNVRGHGAFLVGYTSPRALWFYFPVLLTIKLNEALLVLGLVVLALRPLAYFNWAFLAAAALLAFSFTFRVQIGIRLILPLIALGLVGLAAALAQAMTQGRHSRLLAGLTGTALLWMLATAVEVWPHGLSYVNALWGGTRHGYVYVSEANYDWGQGLPELVRWQNERGIGRLGICYYGSDPQISRLPLEVVPLYSLPLTKPEDLPSAVPNRFLAISTTMLYGAVGDTFPMRQARAYLRGLKPIGRTMTFLIYDLSPAQKGQKKGTAAKR
jgi:hypothetical protein